MAQPASSPNHTFTRSELKLATHLFEQEIKKFFGKVWQIKSDGEYKGCSWACRSPIAFDSGIWRLCQAALHKNAVRAAGRIELKDVGTLMVFTILYEPVKQEEVIYEQ